MSRWWSEKAELDLGGAGPGGAGLALRRLDEADVDAALALQERVCAHLGEDVAFERACADELKRSIARDICLGLFDGTRMAGLGVLMINRPVRRLHPQSGQRLTTIDSILVDSAYRGYGIPAFFMQRMLIISNALNARYMADLAQAADSTQPQSATG